MSTYRWFDMTSAPLYISQSVPPPTTVLLSEQTTYTASAAIAPTVLHRDGTPFVHACIVALRSTYLVRWIT